MQPCYADVPPYPGDPDDTATIVFPRLEEPPVSDWSEVAPVASADDADQPPAARDNTATGVKAALGAVVAGGMVASQFSGAMGLTEAVGDESRTSMLTSAVASATVLAVPSEPDVALKQRDIEDLHKGSDLVRQASDMHADSVRAAARAAAAHEAYILRGGGNLDDWISVALKKLNLDQAWAPAVKRIVMEESRGNPMAINRWDSNAMAGRPSQGLMQVIPSTFQRYVLPELAGRPITNPVANITAGIRYMLSHYGYLTLGQGGRYVAGQYVGY